MNIIFEKDEVKGYPSLDKLLRNIFGKTIEIPEQKRQILNTRGGVVSFDVSAGEKIIIKTPSVHDFQEGLRIIVAEIIGLSLLRECSMCVVPKVHGVIADEEKQTSSLVLEYIQPAEGYKGKRGWEEAGRRLAFLHTFRGAKKTSTQFDFLSQTLHMYNNLTYGFIHDNYIGASFQKNPPKISWIDFFVEARLQVQLEMARRSNNLDREGFRIIEKLITRLNRLLIEPSGPSILHGDLWSGNIFISKKEEPVLIDPATYIGHSEVDLAMTELFGKLPKQFYDAYNEIHPIDKEYEKRKDIYNLYHLLNHLNLFGKQYLSQIYALLDRLSEDKMFK